jgi:hypothetical protein
MLCVACRKPIERVGHLELKTLKDGRIIERVVYYNNHKCSKLHDGPRKNREINIGKTYHARLNDGFKLIGEE